MQQNGITVLSLFDGMSCGQIALKQLGVIPETYYASEIDKHAIGQTQLNFHNTIQLGSVVDVNVSDLKPIDLLIGGSPCQSFSFAGKMKGMSTKCEKEILSLEQYLELKEQNFEFEGQSYLFWEYVRIYTELRKINPEIKFLLENVLMVEKWERIISKTLDVNPIMINSALVSAQNRKRLYWTNIGMQPSGLFGEMASIIKQPEDKGILLKDILEENVPEKYYLSDKMLQYFSNRAANFNNGKVNIRSEDGKATTLTASMASCDISDNFIKVDKNLNPKKSYCIDANYFKGTSVDNYFEKSRRQLVFEEKNSDMDLICVAMRGRNPENPKSRESGLPTEQMIEPRHDGKTNCLTSVQKDNLVMQINPSKESGGKQPYQQNRVYDINGISPALCAHKSDLLIFGCDYRTDEGFRIRENGKSGTLAARARNDESCGQLAFIKTANYIEWNGSGFDQDNRAYFLRSKSGNLDTKPQRQKVLLNNDVPYKIRRLTPRECGRLQTVPEHLLDKMLSSGISDTQLYKMFGNGWTVSVIAHIFSYLIPYQKE